MALPISHDFIEFAVDFVFGRNLQWQIRYAFAHESAIQIAMANSRIDNGAQFKAVIEKYPELSGNQAVASLMSQITKVEDDLVKKKYQLNNVVSEYNGTIHSFPLSLIRKLVKLDDYVINTPATEAVEEDTPVSDEDLGI